MATAAAAAASVWGCCFSSSLTSPVARTRTRTSSSASASASASIFISISGTSQSFLSRPILSNSVTTRITRGARGDGDGSSRSSLTRSLANGASIYRRRWTPSPPRASGRVDDNRDDAGVVKDMEVYLDSLSLEYDSVWDTKPVWCQPWTIIGSGLGVIIASWFLLHNFFLTGAATLAISLWWFIFLYQYPLAYSEMIAERRKRVEDGREDIYGRKRAE